MLRPARRAPAAVTFQGAPILAPRPRSRAPGRGEALFRAHFSQSGGRAAQARGEGHRKQLPRVSVLARRIRLPTQLSRSLPRSFSRALGAAALA